MKKSPKSPNPKSPKSGKKSTTWDPVLYGGKLSKEQMNSLDRTVGKPSESEDVDIHFNQYVPDQNLVGRSAQLEDVEYEEDDDDEEVLRSSAGGKSGGSMFSMFSNLVGNKALTRDDLEPVLAKLRDNLIAKNVASEVAASLIESVMVKLEGSVMGTFQSIARTVKDALTQSLMKLLTPKRRIDILRDVLEAKENKKPYVITFCGVNGVGKSTNLAKICFWLIENKFNVLIAACDTFRAGAVEQLRTHTRRLNSLHPAENNKGRQMVQSILRAAMSLTMTAHLKSSSACLVSRICLSKVVFPAPRNPQSRDTGTGSTVPAFTSSILRAAMPEEVVSSFTILYNLKSLVEVNQAILAW